MNTRPQKQNNNSDLLRYASLGTQLLVSLGIAVFLGYHADRKTDIGFPLFIILFPVIVLVALIYKLIKDTSNRKNGPENL